MPLIVVVMVVILAGCSTPLPSPDEPTQGEIEKHVRMHKMKIDDCYFKATLDKGPPYPKGSVMMAFAITPEGKVLQARVVKSTLSQKTTEDCLVDVVSNIVFPKPRDKREIGVQYTFNFQGT